MKLVTTRGLQVGSELAKPIYNDNGRILIQKDVNLSQAMIDRLQELGVTYVYIRDEISEDIIIHSPISDELKIESIQTVKSLFKGYENQGFKNKSFLFDHTSNKMTNLVDTIIRQIQDDDQVLSIMSDIFISDDYLFTHSVNVTIYSIAIANALKLTNKKTQELGIGAILHDVGKVFIPEEVLKKEGRLTSDEFEVIKSHTELGFEFLRASQELPLLAAHCAFQHHERLDGSGYPRGIRDEEIHPFGKILAVADVFDAVTSNRVYRDAMLPQEGLDILYAGSGKLFDQEIVRVFRESIAIYPNGITVNLNDHRTAIVVRQNENLAQRPVVRVIKESDQVVVPYDLDLSTALDITIIGYAH
ncbi:putative nucleotidyltransferase with HDIG domain [Natronobacillus azotifigens]|uniref:HD-GYP domain-containing protein n=1 Tax=Natronobacillus azotifigens TaxID=472978 RepID=A0A9J6RD21_9BACI|nr:HD-GYP domain-containing protein [Natronobacillus azotifigens]MCZ0703262.1 HD-GYP domain-containing protein [Natronobacillus azotifigens]